MYVICYDITKTRARNKIFKELENYGKHIQYSVFECELTKKRLKTLLLLLEDYLKEDPEGNIRIYSICDNCYEKRIVLGKKEMKDEHDMGIFIV